MLNTVGAGKIGEIVDGLSTDNAAAVFALESLIRNIPESEHADIPATHHFHAGMYIRSIVIPKSMIVVGRMHKYPHFEVMVSGDVTVSAKDGPERVTGFHIFEGMPGKKRAFYAHEDTRWITVHITPKMSTDEVFEHMTVGSLEEFEAFMLESSQPRIQKSEG